MKKNNADNKEILLPGPEALFLCGMDLKASGPLSILAEKTGFGRPRLVFCTASMVGMPLSEALSTAEGGPPLASGKLPPVCLFSGLSPIPIKNFLESFHTTGLPRPIFATTTERNLDMTVRDLILHLLEEKKAQTGR